MLEPIPHPRPEETPRTQAYFGGFTSHPGLKETRKYMRGDCGHMALALHSLMPGSRIWSVGSGHFATEGADGYFWDIRGRMSMAQLWSGLSGPRMTPISREDLIKQLDSGVYKSGFYSESQERAAARLIKTLCPHLHAKPAPKGLTPPKA